jgi:hypothetical protein
VTFSFRDVELERPITGRDYDLLLGVVATFEIRVDGRLLFSEVLFPIVELCVAMKRWSAAAMASSEAFEFESMDSDEVGLVWFRPEGDGWRVGTLNQEYPEARVWTTPEVREMVEEFVEEVEDWLTRNVGVSLETLS